MGDLVAYACLLILPILMVNANEKLELNKDQSSNNEALKHFAETLAKSDSENSAKPELGVIQKPILLKDTAKSQAEEVPIKHMKLLPESENVSKHDSSSLRKVTSANDNIHNEAVSPSLLPLQNDCTIAPDNTINSTIVRTTVSTKNETYHQLTKERPEKAILDGNHKNVSLNVPAHSNSSKNNFEIREMYDENVTIKIQEITIIPIEIEVTDVVTSMIFENTENGITDVYPEETVGVAVIEDTEIDGKTDQPESETELFIDPLIKEPLIEAITELENVDLEITVIPEINSSWPMERFDFLVFDENSSTPCILMTMNMTLNITYETKDGKSNTIEYQLPNELIVSGHCGNQTSSMTISWAKSLITPKQNSITYNFVQDNSSFYTDSVNINFVLDPDNFPNAKDAFISGSSSKNLRLFSAPVQNGIHVCSTVTQISCGKIVANMTNVTLIAYNENQDLTDRKEEHCNVTHNFIDEVNVGGIIGGIAGVVIVVAIIATVCSWYRRRTDTTLSELP